MVAIVDCEESLKKHIVKTYLPPFRAPCSKFFRVRRLLTDQRRGGCPATFYGLSSLIFRHLIFLLFFVLIFSLNLSFIFGQSSKQFFVICGLQQLIKYFLAPECLRESARAGRIFLGQQNFLLFYAESKASGQMAKSDEYH